MQTSPLGHVHYSELQHVLQSHRNTSSNLRSTGGKSIVLGSRLDSDYLHPHSIASNYFSHSPHSLGNILSDCGIVLLLRLVVSYMLLLRLKTSSPFRSIVHNANCRSHLGRSIVHTKKFFLSDFYSVLLRSVGVITEYMCNFVELCIL